jgi:hypothetical protein
MGFINVISVLVLIKKPAICWLFYRVLFFAVQFAVPNRINKIKHNAYQNPPTKALPSRGG